MIPPNGVMKPAAGVTARGVALLLPGYTGSKEDFTLVHEPLAARVGVAPAELEDGALLAAPDAERRVHVQVAEAVARQRVDVGQFPAAGP